MSSHTFRQLSYSAIEHTSHNSDVMLEETLHHFANTYTSDIVEDNYNANAKYLKWTCFECKKKIQVDATALMRDKWFDEKTLFCDAHRPPDHSQTFKTNVVFQKYVMAFHSFLKTTLTKNSKVSNLIAWQELQISESTSQLTPPEYRSLYPKRKRNSKKLYTFKSALTNAKSQDQ